MCAQSLNRVQLFGTLWTVAHQALSMGFSRQEYWSGLPCPPPGDLPTPGIKPASPASLALQTSFSRVLINFPWSREKAPFQEDIWIRCLDKRHSSFPSNRTGHFIFLKLPLSSLYLFWSNQLIFFFLKRENLEIIVSPDREEGHSIVLLSLALWALHGLFLSSPSDSLLLCLSLRIFCSSPWRQSAYKGISTEDRM